MTSETSTTDYEVAVDRVVGFLQQFDRAHFDLACHAAFPLVITPDLLYQIWLRFVPQAPWTAVARLLLSRLCREVGYELYEMDIAVRNLLLAELKDNEEFNQKKPRLEELADFLTSYVKQQFAGDNPHTKNLAQGQYWTALAYTKPEQLSRELLEAINSRLKEKNWKELFRLSSLVETFAEPLAEFAPLLITYARGMASFTVGDVESATEQFSKLPRRDRLVHIVDGKSLYIPDEVPLPTVGLDFLLELLRIILDSNGDPQIVYPILRENLDKIDYSLAELLRSWAATILPSVELEQAQGIAAAIMTLSNLLSEFPLGDRASNLEIAITGYEIDLGIFTRDNFPEQWAMTQNNLGIAYKQRILGEKAENLERAIACFHSALQVQTRQAFSTQWAMTQNNLGGAYSQRLRGDRADNLEQAISYFVSALEIYTREDFPVDWANTQNNLGIAYRDRIRGERAANLERAIACFQSALQLQTREAFPTQWAMAQNNLGRAYSQRIQGDRAANLEEAIYCLTNALQVYTYEAFPINWAENQSNLAEAYRQRIRGEKAENLEVAINCFMKALQVYTREAFPIDWTEALNKLGFAYLERIIGDRADNLEQAISYFVSALKIYTREDFPVDWANTQNNLGIAYRERIRGERAENLEQAINCFENALQVYTRDSFPQQWAETQKKIWISYLERSIAPITLAQIQSIIPDERTSIINWYLQDDSFQTFIITQQSDVPSVWQASTLDSSALIEWTNEYFKYYLDYLENEQQWRDRLSLQLQKLSQILHLDEILNYLPTTCDQLILIPHRFLHCIPLHALPLADESYLLDRFPGGVRYAPSCQLLQLVQTRQRLEFSHFFAIQNPARDLAYTDIEVETIKQYFPHTDVLAKAAATKDVLNNPTLHSVHCLHFSGHSDFNTNSPLQSRLFFADGFVTLAEIFTLDLSQCRLVTLSASETALTDWTSASDECIGFPSAFLLAGSASVVGSLWAPSDISTAFLIIKFYQNLQTGSTVAVALNQAQIWLRNITKAELKFWITANSLPLDPTMRQIFNRRLHKLQDDQKPFQDPFHWAAFCAMGQ